MLQSLEYMTKREQSSTNLLHCSGGLTITNHTVVELIGPDRLRHLSEIFAVLIRLEYNVNAAEVWTHNFRVAYMIYFKDTKTDCPIQSQSNLDLIKERLSRVMKGDRVEQSARCKIEYATENTHIERQLY